uniref:Uncharacterized protein n=1 Tax=Leptobrachium leishanense TaxID=445787 RepID=A0A8C5PE76_9ANUR
WGGRPAPLPSAVCGGEAGPAAIRCVGGRPAPLPSAVWGGGRPRCHPLCGGEAGPAAIRCVGGRPTPLPSAVWGGSLMPIPCLLKFNHCFGLYHFYWKTVPCIHHPLSKIMLPDVTFKPLPL